MKKAAVISGLLVITSLLMSSLKTNGVDGVCGPTGITGPVSVTGPVGALGLTAQELFELERKYREMRKYEEAKRQRYEIEQKKASKSQQIGNTPQAYHKLGYSIQIVMSLVALYVEPTQQLVPIAFRPSFLGLCGYVGGRAVFKLVRGLLSKD